MARGNTAGAATQDARFPDDHLSIIVFANAPYYSYNTTVRAVYNVLVPSERSTNSAQAAQTPPSADPQRVRAAEKWLKGAIAGHIDMAGPNGDMRALLTPKHRAALRTLSQYGKRTYVLDSTDRRNPTTSYIFTVKAQKKTLMYVYKRDDDGKVADILILPNMEFDDL